MIAFLRRFALRNFVVLFALLSPLAVLNRAQVEKWGQGLQKQWTHASQHWFASTDVDPAPGDDLAARAASNRASLERVGFSPSASPASASPASASAASGFPASGYPPSDLWTTPTLPSVDSSPMISWVALPEVFRFDQDAAQLTRRYPRVMWLPGDGQLRGLRTALVTGTAPHDLAGSATYYFDAENVIQRIAFDGATRDPAPLAQFIATSFRLEVSPASPDFYLSRPEFPLSALYLDRGGVIRARGPADPPMRVVVELNRPYKAQRLSPATTRLLEDKGLLAPTPVAASSAAKSSSEPPSTAPPPPPSPSAGAPSATYVPPREGSGISVAPPPQSAQSQSAPPSATTTTPSTWSGVPLVNPNQGYRGSPIN